MDSSAASQMLVMISIKLTLLLRDLLTEQLSWIKNILN